MTTGGGIFYSVLLLVGLYVARAAWRWFDD